MSKHGAAAARDDASPPGKDDEGSSSDGEPSSPLEPSEAFKRPRLASDARKPNQTRAREPLPPWLLDTSGRPQSPRDPAASTVRALSARSAAHRGSSARGGC